LVKRHVDPQQRRRNWIALTAKARRTLERIQEAFVAYDAEFLSPLTRVEQRQLAGLLRELSHAQRSAGAWCIAPPARTDHASEDRSRSYPWPAPRAVTCGQAVGGLRAPGTLPI
jgi:hypothetical protein